jgi:hypothetical protein
MQFLSPIWFLAFAALSVPVAIHLWNIRPGKTLKVGSISLITEASKITRRSFRLLDILLLALRCMLLAVAALFLASPAWQHYSSQQEVKGWLLIPKENLRETYLQFKPAVDSLTAAGYEFHFFDEDFAKGDIGKILADTTLKDVADNRNYWALVNQLGVKAGVPKQVHVFTPNGMRHFRGSKPVVPLNLLWRSYTQKDSVSRWIASASLTNTGAIAATEAVSTPTGVAYNTHTIQGGGDGGRDLSVNVQNGQPMVTLKGTGQQPVTVDTSTMRIAVYTDKYQPDAKYLMAALSAAVHFGGKKAVVKAYRRATDIPERQTWLFWLSEQPVVNINAANVFKYEAGKVSDVKSWIVTGDVPLAKLTTSPKTFEPLWQDGYGRPVLALQRSGNINIYHFYTRFSPIWSDLVWHDAFPKMMLQLVNKTIGDLPAHYDKRVLSNAQLQPRLLSNNEGQLKIAQSVQTDISPYFWVLLLILFVAERLLAHQLYRRANG